jgi:hypothetical protein
MLASAEVAGIAKPTPEANGKILRYFLNSGSVVNATGCAPRQWLILIKGYITMSKSCKPARN